MSSSPLRCAFHELNFPSPRFPSAPCGVAKADHADWSTPIQLVIRLVDTGLGGGPSDCSNRVLRRYCRVSRVRWVRRGILRINRVGNNTPLKKCKHLPRDSKGQLSSGFARADCTAARHFPWRRLKLCRITLLGGIFSILQFEFIDDTSARSTWTIFDTKVHAGCNFPQKVKTLFA